MSTCGYHVILVLAHSHLCPLLFGGGECLLPLEHLVNFISIYKLRYDDSSFGVY